VPDDLMAELPEPGSVVSERAWPLLGATELLLNNGMRVLLKETDHLEDELLVTGFARGGLSQVRAVAWVRVGMGEGWGLGAGV
jgi:hypothetical protein